jgi:L-2,4-diaminobutyric acid acetyltransferase
VLGSVNPSSVRRHGDLETKMPYPGWDALKHADSPTLWRGEKSSVGFSAMSAGHPCEQDAPSMTMDEVFEPPRLEDGRHLWRIARDSQTLDLNSPYCYVLWCRDFAATSVVARAGGRIRGFVIGFDRPGEPGTLFVWQVAVDAAWRGRALGVRMLDHLAGRGHRFVEATVTPDNTASDRLFAAFARDRGVELTRTPFLAGELFPGEHEPEDLYRIGPLDTRIIQRDR